MNNCSYFCFLFSESFLQISCSLFFDKGQGKFEKHAWRAISGGRQYSVCHTAYLCQKCVKNLLIEYLVVPSSRVMNVFLLFLARESMKDDYEAMFSAKTIENYDFPTVTQQQQQKVLYRQEATASYYEISRSRFKREARE